MASVRHRRTLRSQWFAFSRDPPPEARVQTPCSRSFDVNANTTLALNSVPWQPQEKIQKSHFSTPICYFLTEVVLCLTIDSLFNTMTMSIQTLLILAVAAIVAANQHIADSPFLNQYFVDSGYVTISTAGSVSGDLEASRQRRCVLIKPSRMPPTPPILPNATTAMPMFAHCLVLVPLLSLGHLLLGAHTPIRWSPCE